MITRKKLCWMKNGQIYSAHLLTNKALLQRNLAVYADGENYYVRCTTGSSSNMLSFIAQLYGTTFPVPHYVQDVTPKLTVQSNLTHNPAPYVSPDVVNSLSMSLNVAINNIITLQYKDGNSWYTLLTLPAGATSATFENTGSRIASNSWRVTVSKSWLRYWSSSWTQSYGSATKTISIPEEWWGV